MHSDLIAEHHNIDNVITERGAQSDHRRMNVRIQRTPVAGVDPGGCNDLKARGVVDESRMAVSGWSYGGYMTVWLSAHYPVWRAAA